MDVATFMSWADAYAQDQQRLAAFYLRRVRAEFRRVLDAWIATRPLQNPEAPLTPFAMPQYKLATREQSEQVQAEAELWTTRARTNVQRSTNYVLAVVLFAAVLFFAGMGTRLPTLRLRRLLLGMGLVLFVGTVIWIATFPISVSV